MEETTLVALIDHLDALDNTPDPADQADSEKGLKDTGNHHTAVAAALVGNTTDDGTHT